MTPFSQQDIERFWSRVEKGPGCWTWIGGKRNKGYGSFCVNYVPYAAHRVSYALHNDDLDLSVRIPMRKGVDAMKIPYVMHTCDNPSCVNPAHLRLGNVVENSDDKVSKGRHARGESIPSAKLNPDRVRDIRSCDGSKEAIAKMAEKHGVSFWTASEVFLRKSWRSVE